MTRRLKQTHPTSLQSPARIWRSLLLMAIAATLASTPAAAGRLYRWVDDEGRVHYSDRIPSDQVDKERELLNKRGIQVKKIGAAKTREQIEREQELKRLRAAQQRLIEQQRAKDRVLLRTFRSGDDILMTRDGKLSSVDTSIQITRSNIQQLKLRLADMQKSAADLERQGKTISPAFLRDIASTRQQLKENYAAIIRKEQDKEAIRKKYAADLARFNELKNLRPDKGIGQAREKKGHSLLETVVYCDQPQRCDAAWALAEQYVRQHATTRLQMLARNIIMTANPVTDKDISITVARIRNKGQPGARLFMDLQCKRSPRGRDLCESEPVDRIRKGFRTFLEANLAQGGQAEQGAGAAGLRGRKVTPETAGARSGATAPPTAPAEKSGTGSAKTGAAAPPGAPSSGRPPVRD